VIPLVLLLAGLVLLGIGWLALRRVGPGARIGRLLAATPRVTVAEARALAEDGRARYVAVLGRIDATEEFEDEHHRPLVFRRVRLEARDGRGWTPLEDSRQAVPFELSEGLDRIAVDEEALGDGLVVVRRTSEGTAAEIPDLVPEGIAPTAPVHLTVEQLSSVDHGLALGVPRVDPGRGPLLGAGLGRPLVLTNLDRDEAVRLLAVDHRTATRLSAVLLAAGVASFAVGIGWALVDAVA
jgi:hypothetical protein